MMKDQQRSFWNAVKGIGMLCIVIGHSFQIFPYAIEFVYLFHLAVFFFVSGFLYSEIKYGDAPLLHCWVRFRKTWPRYVFYMLCFVVLHNFFLEHGMIIGAQRYGITDMLRAAAFTLALNGYESMGGALWFVPVMLAASAGFGFIVYAGRKAQVITGYPISKNIVITVLTCIAGGIGIYANMNGKFFKWHIQTSLVVIPLYTAAWAIRTYVRNWTKALHWIPLAAAVGILLYGLFGLNWKIELAANNIYSPLGFYVISLLGIYAVLCMAKYVLCIPVLNRLFVLAGEHSFDVMAGHFLVFKLIDVVYAGIMKESNAMVYGVFPCAYSSSCWLLYAVLGLVCPVIFGICLSKILGCVKRRAWKLEKSA